MLGGADRLKQLAGDAGGRGAQQEALGVLFEGDFLQPVEIPQDVVPFVSEAVAAPAAPAAGCLKPPSR
jgi:hypothetical protein